MTVLNSRRRCSCLALCFDVRYAMVFLASCESLWKTDLLCSLCVLQ